MFASITSSNTKLVPRGRSKNDRATCFSAYADLPLAVADVDVHSAPDNRLRPLFWHAADGLVADRGWFRPQTLWQGRQLRGFVFWASHPVRLHLGADPSHAWRHSA